MTKAQQVAAHYQEYVEMLHLGAGDVACARRIAELNAIADLVKAGEQMADDASAEREWAREHGGDPNYEQAFQDSHKSGGFDDLLAKYRTALDALHKALGLEVTE